MGALHPRPPVVEEPPHRAATPRPSAKQMGRDPDTDPMILIPRGLLDWHGVVGLGIDGQYNGGGRFVSGFTMVNGGPTLFRAYLREERHNWAGGG